MGKLEACPTSFDVKELDILKHPVGAVPVQRINGSAGLIAASGSHLEGYIEFNATGIYPIDCKNFGGP